jgi:outer membrane protein assembly factor BamB
MADIQDLFASLGAYADSAPGGSPEPARRRGNRRRRATLVARTAVVMLVVFGIAFASVGLVRRSVAPAQPLPRPTVSFTHLTPIGSGIMLRDPVGFSVVAIEGDRAYVASFDAGHILVGAIDVTTGQTVFSPVDLGPRQSFNGMIATQYGVLIYANGTLLILDPDTLALRWQTPFSGGIELYPDILVVRPSAAGPVTGYNWQTGAVQWQISAPSGSTFSQNLNTFALAPGPVDSVNREDPGDRRLLRMDSDGTLRVYDGLTGALLETHPGAGVAEGNDKAATYLTVNQQMLTVVGGTKLYRYDLATGRASRYLYTAPAGRHIEGFRGCLPDLICVVTNGPVRQLVAVDAATGQARWSIDAGSADRPELSVSAEADRILTDGGELFDLSGHRLYQADPTNTQAGWVTAGSVLALTRGTDSTTVTGVSTADGSHVDLGVIPPVPGTCGWTTAVLICPTVVGFHAWRFAN